MLPTRVRLKNTMTGTQYPLPTISRSFPSLLKMGVPSMHPEFVASIKHIAQSSNDPNPGANRISRTYWTQRILVANAKGVAHTILNHLPTCRNHSCRCNREVYKPALIPIQRNAQYNSSESLQATATILPTDQHTSTSNPQSTNSNPQTLSLPKIPAFPFTPHQQPSPTSTSIWTFSTPIDNRYAPLMPFIPPTNLHPSAVQTSPYPYHHQYLPNHNAQPIPTPPNQNYPGVSNATPGQARRSPPTMNDLPRNLLLHHQPQSSIPSIPTCNAQ